MILSTEDKILIKALRQKKSYWTRKLTVEFRNKTWTLSGLSYTCRNQGHRLSGEEARQRDKAYDEHKRRHWISSGTGCQPRKSAVTDPPVHEITTETDQDNHSHQVSIFWTQHWKLFSVPKIRQLINPSVFKVNNFAQLLTIRHYFLQILFKSVEIWLFYHQMRKVTVFFSDTLSPAVL